MAKHQLTFTVLCVFLLFQSTFQQNVSFQLLKEIDRYTSENYVLSVVNLEIVLFEIYAAKAIENSIKLERNLITGIGDIEARIEIQKWGLRYKKASRAKFEMAYKVAVPQNLPLSQKLRLIDELLIENAKKYDVSRDVKPSKSMDSWLSSHLDDVLASFVQVRKLNASENIVAISGMSITPPWNIRFQSQTNRYFYKKHPTGYGSSDPLCVPMMHSFYSFETMSTDEAKGIFIPFSLANMGMLVLLPRKGVSCKDILDNLSNQIDVELSRSREIHLFLPIFKEKFDYNIAKFLNEIDIVDAFKDSPFNSNASIKINDFRVNHGIQFKPVHRFDVVDGIDTQNAERFEVNRSFVFVIKDSEFIYAVGRIENLDGLTRKVDCSKKQEDLKL